MSPSATEELFDLTGTVAVVTGAYGALGKSTAMGLARAGAKVGLLGRKADELHKAAEEIRAVGGEALPLVADVLDRGQLEEALAKVVSTWYRVDHLLNYAGGNRPDATTNPNQTYFDLPVEGLEAATRLNQLGTLLPCQVFGKHFAERKTGNILNVSSMAALKPLTRVVAYSAAKAAIANFTQWLSVYMAKEHSPEIRVNAIAPGFFLGNQNRALLIDSETGKLTPRGQTIVDHTPMGRFGEADELVGAVQMLLSPAGKFITGVVIPIDGGYSAFGGI